MVSSVALDEESARAELIRLLNRNAEKNETYCSLQRSLYQISNLRFELSQDREKIVNTLEKFKRLTNDISITKSDILSLENEKNEYDEETFQMRKLRLEKKLHKYEMESRDFETEDIYKKKIAKLDIRIQNLQTEYIDAEKKANEIRESVETNCFRSPDNLYHPINFTLDYRSSSGKTLGQILSGPPSDMRPFYTTSFFGIPDPYR